MMTSWSGTHRLALSLYLLSLLAALAAAAQDTASDTTQDSGQGISFQDYDPPSTLVAPKHPTTRAKYPFVDVHNHQFALSSQDLQNTVSEMDKLNMAVMVNLSGRGFRRTTAPDGSVRFGLQEPEYLNLSLETIAKTVPGRLLVFTNVDVSGVGESGWAEAAVAQLATDVEGGAVGLKIYKNLGMEARDTTGQRLATDDPRLDLVWEKCAELGIPVLIHTGDPAPFWQPKDKNNERLLELIERPERYRDPEKNAPWEQIMAEQHNLFRRHPRTVFINAHLGWLGNDLERLGKLLDEAPNVYTEIGAVLAELGRQPRVAREWFIKYQDRVMFGKDSWDPEEYYVYFRVLETADDYFDYYRRRHAFWKMYGLDLPDEVLRKVYYQNALRVIPGIDRSLFPE